MQDYSFPPPQRPAPAAQPSTLPWLLIILALLAVVWLSPGFLERIEYARTRGRERAEVESAREQLSSFKNLDSLSVAFTAVAKSIGPSVVHIDTESVVDGGSNDELSFPFGRGRQYEVQGQGSGVIVDAAGYILTNNHVVQGANQIAVRLSDGRAVPGDVIGADPATDLAVIKIDAADLIAAEFGDSKTMKPGSLVWAVGNPYGLDRSITFGIVSATGRRNVAGGSPYQDFLQTDAAVNPGNSGGPLVNTEGKVIGINTAIIGKAYQGISFAITSETAQEVYERLKTHGTVVRGYLGVGLQDLDLKTAKQLGLKDTKGGLVTEVAPGSPAQKAGLRPSDVVAEWNGHPIDNAMTLRLLVARTEVNTTVNVVVIRDGERMTLKVAVESRPVAQRGR